MQKLSLAQFVRLIRRDDWSHEQEIEILGTDIEVINLDKDGDIEVEVEFGMERVYSTLDDIKIIYTGLWRYRKNDRESLTVEPDEWEFDGLVVLDTDGEEMSPQDAIDVFLIPPAPFVSVNYSELEFNQTIDVDEDMSEDDNDGMKEFLLDIDNRPSLRFVGRKLGWAESRLERVEAEEPFGAGPRRATDYTGRWTELRLYQTKGGKYVCHQIGRTEIEGEQDRYSGKVCTTEQEVIAFFGHRWLAKELYDMAGIEDVETIY